MKAKHLTLAAAAALAAATVLVACGGGSSGSSTSASTTSSASGVVSAFGSIYVNGTKYVTGGSTSVVDGDADDAASSLGALQVGMTVDVDAGSSGSGPTANFVRFTSAVRGEVDTVDAASNTLTVLGQPVQVTGATSFAGSRTSGGTTTPITQLSNVNAGDYVVVYGYFQCTSTGTTCTAASIVATLIVEPGAAGPYRVEGYAQNVNAGANSFSINGLTVDYTTTGAGATVCTPAPCSVANGDFVAVRGPSAPTSTGGVLTLAAARIKGASQAPVLVVGTTISIEGPVSNYSASPFSFDVRGIPVDASGLSSTTIALANRDIVEVTGTVTASGTIVATAINVERHASFSVTAPMDADSATADTVTVLGQTFTVDNSTRFVDWAQGTRPFNLGNFASVLSVGDQLIVSGYATGTGNVATRVERIPTPATPTVGVEGLVTADSASADTLTIGGITATLTATTNLHYPSGGASPTLAGFFSAISVNSSVAWVFGTAGASAGTLTASNAAALPSNNQWASGPH
jgi:hypothetical protein